VAAAAPTRKCTACGQLKPVDEFYRRHRDGRTSKICPRCRDCDNTRTRSRTEARVVRVRARHRAVADLIANHRAEFDALLERHALAARAEASALATAAAQQHADSADHHPHATPHPAEELPRLRPGPRRPGQTVTERLDVARCAQCVKHHDRGHTCPNCGAAPMTRDELLAVVRGLLAEGRDVLAIAQTLRLPLPRVGELVDAATNAERAS